MCAHQDYARNSHSVYTRLVLAVYDPWVVRLSNRFIWRCPWREILSLYDRSVSPDHLEVGVGTGFFLDRCRPRKELRRLGLLDANPHCLARTARRLARYRPEQYVCDLLTPIELAAERFDSLGLNYVLHCLPGPLREKATALDRLKPLLRPGGVLFGSTILAEGVDHSRAARWLMATYNRKGIFANAGDSLDDLRTVLQERCAQSEIWTRGSVALFLARL